MYLLLIILFYSPKQTIFRWIQLRAKARSSLRREEEANIVQRIAKGVCIGRHLQPKELKEFNHDPNAFINKLAKKVIDGETEPLTLEKEDYEQASAIYDRLLSYVGRTMSKKKAFEEAASKRIKSDFMKPQTHIKEGIESIASKVKPKQDSS